MDLAGEHQLDVVDNVWKKRIDKENKPISGVTKETLTSYDIRKDTGFTKKKRRIRKTIT